MALKLQYQEVGLDDVLNYFIEGYEYPEGTTLALRDVFVDTMKRKVIFKLLLEEVE